MMPPTSSPRLSSRSALLDLRGGAVFGTPISKENLAWLLMGEAFFNGVIGIAAPETLAECYSSPGVKEGSLAHLSYEYLGAGYFSLAMALYMARFTKKPAYDIVAFSAIPCAFVTFRHFLKGTPAKIGFRKGSWELFLLQYVVGIEMIMARKMDIKLVARIFAGIPTIIGLSGMLDKSFSKAIWGVTIHDGMLEDWNCKPLTEGHTGKYHSFVPFRSWQVQRKLRFVGCLE